ncbi:MAG: transposase [Lentisphaeria bacterium]|nr:transposase [Lentisphaeria bacterium]
MEKSVKKVFNYSAEFKIRVILDMLDNGLNIHEVVRKYWNVTKKIDVDKYRSSVRTWLRIYKEKGTSGFMPKTPTHKSKDPSAPPPKKSKEYDLPAILAENEYLRMENAYLKKLRALILKEEQEKRNRRK